MLPSTTGGANWQGGSFDPDTGILYIFSNTQIGAIGLVQAPNRSDMDYVEGAARPPAPPRTAGAAAPRAAGAPVGGGEEGGVGLSVLGLPLVKPPWGRITAIDLNKGEIVWAGCAR